jgi:hypothetical protein
VVINLISHVFNESYLLPSWIKHHREMFDCATIIDYASSDSTVDLIKRHAPSAWRVVASRNADFDAEQCDHEVMEVEEGLPGWKIALNATEFLVFPEIRSVLNNLEARSKSAVRISGYVMADPSDIHHDALDSGETLWSKYHFGVPEHELHRHYPPSETSRPVGRLMHSNSSGQYLTGRHAWQKDDGELPRSVASILWYGFSPWTKKLVDRKIQIRQRVPTKNLLAGIGTHNHDRLELFDDVRRRYLNISYDLNSLPEFQQVTGMLGRNSSDLGPELHLNGLPFGHKFSPPDLAQYVNAHFGIESKTVDEAWQYLAKLKMLEVSNDQTDTEVKAIRRHKIFRSRK